MPLFECAECHAIDNTALGSFWWRVLQDRLPALCTACDPEFGAWHNKFPKTTLTEYRALHPDSPIQYTVEVVTAMNLKTPPQETKT